MRRKGAAVKLKGRDDVRELRKGLEMMGLGRGEEKRRRRGV